jgi:hypothetical protein
MLKYASGTSVNNATLKTLDGVEVAIMSREPNCYSTTAGSFIQSISFAKFKSSNSFIINKTLPD